MATKLLIPSVMLFALGFSLRVTMRLVYGARGPAPNDALYFLLRIASWTLLMVPSALVLAAGVSWLSLLLFAIIAEALLEYMLARRHAQREGVWRLFVSSFSGSRGLGQSLQIHSARFTGIVGRSFRRLTAALAAGVPWRRALAENRGALPRDSLSAAALAIEGSNVIVDPAEFDAMRDPVFAEVMQQIIQRMTYLSTVLLAGVGLVTFVAIKIVPAYQDIYEDYGLTLPEITLFFIGLLSNVGDKTALVLTLLALAFIMAGIVTLFCYLADVPVLRPVVDRLSMSRHRAQVMHLIATAIGREMPIDVALTRLTTGWGAYPSGVVRRKLSRALKHITRGEQWQDALQSAKLISGREARVLRTAEEVGNLPWTLRLLAGRRLRLMTFRWATIQHLVFSVLVLSFGAFVMLFCVAMFVPIIDLINNLSM